MVRYDCMSKVRDCGLFRSIFMVVDGEVLEVCLTTRRFECSIEIEVERERYDLETIIGYNYRDNHKCRKLEISCFSKKNLKQR